MREDVMKRSRLKQPVFNWSHSPSWPWLPGATFKAQKTPLASARKILGCKISSVWIHPRQCWMLIATAPSDELARATKSQSMTERRPLIGSSQSVVRVSSSEIPLVQQMSEVAADCQIPFITSLYWTDQTDQCLPSFRAGPKGSVKYYPHCGSVCDVTTTEKMDFQFTILSIHWIADSRFLYTTKSSS